MKLPDLNNCKIAVLGMGYVGLPLAVEFAKTKKCNRSGKDLNRIVIGYDINETRLSQLKRGIDTTREVIKEDLQKINNIEFTSNISSLYNADVFIVTVPTPIDKNNNPNFHFIKKATSTVGKSIKERKKLLSKTANLHSSPIIIYESTVYPGVTE